MKQAQISVLIFMTLATLVSCSTTKNPFKKKEIEPLKIDFDFESPALGKTRYAEPGRNIELTLQNINPNVYNVTVNDSIVVYEKQKPDQFENLFNKMPELKAVNPTTDTTTTSPPNPDGPAASASGNRAARTAAARRETQYNTEKTKIEKIDDELAVFLVYDYVSVKRLFSETVDYSDMPAELNGVSINCLLSQTEKTSKANAYVTEKLTGITNAQIPVGIESFVNNAVKITKEVLLQNESIAKNLIKKYTEIKESADESISLNQYKAIEKSVDEKLGVLNDVMSNIGKMKDKIAELEKTKPGASIVEAYNNVLSAKINKVVLKNMPRKAGDEYLLKVTIEKKTPTKNCITEPSSFTLPVYVEKGIKIDFSTGLVFNFGRDKFFDQKYRYDSVYRSGGIIADSVKITKIKSNNISQVSIGAFGHVYTRIRGDFNLGGMFGVSLSADQRVYYHAGLSALIGKNDRFVISSGISVAKAKYLDTQYDVDQVMKRSYAPTTIPVEEVTRVGFFISLSYNLNLIK